MSTCAAGSAGISSNSRRQVGGRAHDVLGLPLGLLVRVAELLPRVELALAERAGVLAGDVGGRDVHEALEAPERLALAREPDDLARALDVDRPRLVERHVERDRRRAVHDRADLLGQAGALAGGNAQPILR